MRAPVAGIVGGRRAEIGIQVSTSSALFTLGDLSALHVRVNLTDTMIGYIVGYIEVGQPARLLVEDFTGDPTPLAGTVARISPFLDEITRSTDAEVRINITDARLRPGMFLPVDILYGESQQATLVPTSALFTDPNTGSEGIFVIESEAFDPDTVAQSPDALSEPFPVTFRNVSIIARGAQEVAIADLSPSDWVVTLGQDLLASTGRPLARGRPVRWQHVMELQGLNREDLLNAVL